MIQDISRGATMRFLFVVAIAMFNRTTQCTEVETFTVSGSCPDRAVDKCVRQVVKEFPKEAGWELHSAVAKKVDPVDIERVQTEQRWFDKTGARDLYLIYIAANGKVAMKARRQKIYFTTTLAQCITIAEMNADKVKKELFPSEQWDVVHTEIVRTNIRSVKLI